MSKKSAVAVVGMGHSKVYRRAEVPLIDLTREACELAISDAGIEAKQVDGILAQPETAYGAAASIDGSDVVTPEMVERLLGIDPAWMDRTSRVIVHGFIGAAHAIAAGDCRFALVFRSMHNPIGQYGALEPDSSAGDDQFWAPYGLDYVGSFAFMAQRYLHKYGATREDLAKLAVQNRENGLRWEHGYWTQHRPERVTVDEVLSSRMIADPLSIYDCDIPVQGAAAFLLASADWAEAHSPHPAYVLGAANDLDPPMNFVEIGYEAAMERSSRVGAHLWRNSGVLPGDVDVANLYDGFSIIAPLWMEALGIVPEGEALARISAGETAPGGPMPLNPNGGSQGAGRMHGLTHLMESALQVTGRAGIRQVPNAALSVATVGGMASAGGVVFSRHRSV